MAEHAWAYEVARSFVIEDQRILSGPEGLTLEPVQRAGFAPIGGDWRIQFGSGIAGRGRAAALVNIKTGETLGPYVTTKKGLIAQLRCCPGVVCRRCRGWSAATGQPRWKAPEECRFCAGAGTYARKAVADG